jgi:Ca2+-binding RTX toxin-like protein
MRLARLAVFAALAAVLAPVSGAGAAVKTYPGCGATLAACINAAPSGSTIRLRTNALIPIPDGFTVSKTISLVAAKGFHPKIGRVGAETAMFIFAGRKGDVTVRGIAFRQVEFAVAVEHGTGHDIVLERNSVRLDSGTNGSRGLGVYILADARGSATVRGNDVSASGTAIEVAVHRSPVLVSGNRVTGPVPLDSARGIAVDSLGAGTTKAKLLNNLVHHVVGCNCGNVRAVDIGARDSSRLDIEIVNNTVADLVNDPLHQAFGIGIGDPADSGKINARLFNNTVTNTNAIGIRIPNLPAVQASGNRNNTFGIDANELGGHDLGTMLSFDPHFLSDYTLSGASPITNAGQTCIPSLPLPRADGRGRFRVAGAAVDIGAYERGSGSGSVKGVNRTGTNGANTLVGTPGRDVLCGLGGKDMLAGFGGGDYLFGGAGRDRAFGGAGRDLIDMRDGTMGNDSAFGEAGNDTCLTDAGDRRVSC